MASCSFAGGQETKISQEDSLFLARQNEIQTKLERAEESENNLEIAKAYEEIAMLNYESDPETSANSLLNAAQYYQKANDAQRTAAAYLNAGCIFDERLNAPDSALQVLQKSIPWYQKTNNTNGEANVLKYMGLLESKTGDGEIALNYTRKAISMFSKTEHRSGLAVSFYDLARIFETQSNYDSCLYYIEASQNIWDQMGNQDRTFTNNTLAMKAYTSLGELEQASSYFDKNESLRKDSGLNIHYIPLLDYLRQAVSLHEAVNNPKKKAALEKEKNLLLIRLKSDGVNIDNL